jgi:hypothetical protein
LFQKADLGLGQNGLPVVGKTQAGAIDADGSITGARVVFTTRSALSTPLGYLKAALHEGGHLHGLGDNYGFHGSTAMNPFGMGTSGPLPTIKENDCPGNVATSINKCNRDMAKYYKDHRPWP